MKYDSTLRSLELWEIACIWEVLGQYLQDTFFMKNDWFLSIFKILLAERSQSNFWSRDMTWWKLCLRISSVIVHQWKTEEGEPKDSSSATQITAEGGECGHCSGRKVFEKASWMGRKSIQALTAAKDIWRRVRVIPRWETFMDCYAVPFKINKSLMPYFRALPTATLTEALGTHISGTCITCTIYPPHQGLE